MGLPHGANQLQELSRLTLEWRPRLDYEAVQMASMCRGI